MKKCLLPLNVAALLLSGCASESTDAAADTKPESQATTSAAPTEEPVDAMGPGAYTFETADGATGTLNVPGVAPADIEELRIAGGGEPVAYLTGNFDNRQGSDSFDVYEISIYDAEGNEYSYQPADDYLGEFPPADTSAEVYNPYIEMKNSYSTVVDAMQRADFVLVGPELPADIVGVSVSNGFEDFGAQLVG